MSRSDEARVTRFKRLLIEQISYHLEKPVLERSIEAPVFLRHAKPEDEIDANDVPCYRILFRGQGMDTNYTSRLFDDGRLEMVFTAARGEDLEDAEAYLESIAQEISLMLDERKGVLGINWVKPVLESPKRNPFNGHLIDLTAKFDIRIN